MISEACGQSKGAEFANDLPSLRQIVMIVEQMPINALICVAIRMEAQAIARALSLRFNPESFEAAGNVTDGVSVRICVIGVRAVAMPQELEEINLLVSAGLAGAIDPALRCGDIVVDAPEHLRAGNARFGSVHTSDAVVGTVDRKRELFKQTGALAVDMESAHVRAVAEQFKVPFAAIRAISDSADQAIDPAVLELVDPFGKPRLGSVVTTLARRPTLLPDLLRLRSQSNLAAEALGRYIADWLRNQQNIP